MHEVEQYAAVLAAAEGYGYGVIALDHAVLADGVFDFSLDVFGEMKAT